MLWHKQTIFIYVAGHFRAGAAQAIVKHQLQMVLGREGGGSKTVFAGLVSLFRIKPKIQWKILN